MQTTSTIPSAKSTSVWISTAEMPAHAHTVSGNATQPRAGGYISGAFNQYGAIGGVDAVDGWFMSTWAAHWTMNNAGSGSAHNNLQPYQVVNYMVKA